MSEPVIDQVQRSYRAAFSDAPRWTASAPGRVNLIGEHTDYNDGFVLPLAINRRLAVAAGPAMDATGTWASTGFHQRIMVNFASELKPLPGHWANHPLGVLALFQREFGDVAPFNLQIATDIPVGAGLSSSAAMEAVIVSLLERMSVRTLDLFAKARLCQSAEHEFAGTPCGLMDQLAVTMGRANHAMLIDCRRNHVQHVPMPPSSDATLLMIDTGVRRSLSAGGYAERRARCQEASDSMGLKSLRDATPQHIEKSSLDASHRKIALHVVAENMRTVLAAEALVRNDLAELGRLMWASHDSLRDLFEVSWPEADAVVQCARRIGLAGGLFGARMTGGGFGGCVIAFCRTDALSEIERDLQIAFAAKFNRNCELFTVTAVDA